MSDTRVGVIARFEVRKESVGEFAELAQKVLVEPTQSEAGCIRYELWQDRQDPTRFALVEEWENQAALDAHFRQPHMAAGLEKLRPHSTGSIETSFFQVPRTG